MQTTGSVPFSLLKNRDFAWFFWGTFASMFGMGVHLLGVNWYVLQETGSETTVSLIMMTSLGAGLFILPFSGSIIDRHSRKTMVILPDLIRFGIIGLVAVSIPLGVFRLWMLWPMAFVIGCNHAFYFPSTMALLQEILPPEDYFKANALREMTFQVGALSAAGVAGWVIETFGLDGVLFLDAATYLFSAFCISRIRYTPDKARLTETREPYLRTLRAGLAYLWRERAILMFGIISLLPFVTVMALNVLMPTFAMNTLGRGAVVYGLLDMVYGVGAFLAASFIGLLTMRMSERVSLAWLLGAAASFYLICGFTESLMPAFAVLLLLGFCNSGFRVVAQTYLMRIIPPTLMGRCTSTFFMISIFVQLAAIYSVGFLAERVAISAGFGLLAIILYGALLLFFFLRSRLPEATPLAAAATET